MLPLLLLAGLASAQDGASPIHVAPPSVAPLAIPAEVPAALLVTPAAPASVAIFPIRAVNLGSMEVRAAEILFRRRYESATGALALTEDATRAAMAAADDIGLFAACKQLSCARWLTIDLVRLDEEIFVTVTERDGDATVTQRIETSASELNTLPGVFERIGRALALGVPIESVPAPLPRAPTADNELETDGRRPAGRENEGGRYDPEDPVAPRRNRSSDSLVGFKFGVLGPLWPGFSLSLTHTFTWRRERDDRFLELSAGVTVPLGFTDARSFGMGFLEVGLSWIFPSQGPTAFYVGGGLGPRAGGYDALGVGAGVYAQGGVLFARNTSTRPYAQLKLGGDAFTSERGAYVVSYAGLEAGVGF